MIQHTPEVRTTIYSQARADGGECPIWDQGGARLRYIDRTRRSVRSLDPADGSTSEFALEEAPSSIGLTGEGRLVVVFGTWVGLLDEDTGSVGERVDVPVSEGEQLADACVDARGRLVIVGSHAGGGGRVWSIEGTRVRAISDGAYTIGNGPCWSPDGRTFYCADSHTRRIDAYDYDPETGDLSNRRTFADTRRWGGIPDGAVVDSEGSIWIAMFGAGLVARYTADGLAADPVPTPTRWVTSVTFGGGLLDELWATSLDPSPFAGSGGLADELGTEPDEHTGEVFVIRGLGAHGRAEGQFRR